MNQSSVEKLIADATGQKAQIVDTKSVSGGCIHDARRIQLADGRHYFLKSGDNEVLAAETEGLLVLSEGLMNFEGCLRVPEVIASDKGHLILEMGGYRSSFKFTRQ